MADYPTPTETVAEVLQQHRSRPQRVAHSWRGGMLLNITGCTGCDWTTEEINASGEDEHAEHVAAVVLASLSLTEEWAGDCGEEAAELPEGRYCTHESFDEAEDYHVGLNPLVSRLVGPWVSQTEGRDV